MPHRPRWWKADAAYSEVKKTIDDQFWLKPTPEIRNIIGACMGRAQEKHPVKIYYMDANINHFHRGRAPIEGSIDNMAKFEQTFLSLLTKELNRYYDRTGLGTLWAGRTKVTECVDDKSLVSQLIYSVTNMVKDGLLERAAHNKGFGCYKAIASGDLYERFTYIDRTAWHRAGGKRCKRPMSDFMRVTTVTYSKIPEWEHLTNQQYATRFRKEVRAKEQELREKREKENKRVAGIKRLTNLDPRSRPKTPRERTPQPLCHASTVEAENEFRERWKTFLDFRLQASEQFLKGNLHVEFPLGSHRPPLLTCKHLPRPPSRLNHLVNIIYPN
jgi:hypothetical protein